VGDIFFLDLFGFAKGGNLGGAFVVVVARMPHYPPLSLNLTESIFSQQTTSASQFDENELATHDVNEVYE
jgi:hypothetical protein